MPGTTVVLAHQGGWDEALMVVVPVGLFAGLFWVASRRAAASEDHDRPDRPPRHP